MRSGIFSAFAEWAASRVIQYEMVNARAWKPNLLVPVEDPATLRGEFRILVDICEPEGSVRLLGIATQDTVAELTPRIANLGRQLRRDDVLTTWAVIDSAGYRTGVVAGIQALGSAFFQPNTIFLGVPEDADRQADVEAVIREARRLGIGVMLLGMHDRAGIGRAKVVNLWVRPRRPGESLAELLDSSEMHLGVLTAYRLSRAWEAEFNLITAVEDESLRAAASRDLHELRDLCRIPVSARSLVMVGSFEECLGQAPQSDLDILSMRGDGDMAFVNQVVELTRSSCLFTVDSGQASALA